MPYSHSRCNSTIYMNETYFLYIRHLVTSCLTADINKCTCAQIHGGFSNLKAPITTQL